MRHEHIVTVDQSRCIRCGLCKKDCPSGVFVIGEDGAQVTTDRCIKCGHCVAICPQNAIAMSGFEDAPVEVTPAMRVDGGALMGQIMARRSMRHFTAQDVTPQTIAQVLEAGRYTPSGSNKQTVSYAVLRGHKAEYEQVAVTMMRRLKRVADVFTSSFRSVEIDDHFLFEGAPVVIVVKATDATDGALAASTMELMAQSLGLGVLYSGFFTRMAQMSRKLRKKLLASRREKIVATLVLGYPAVTYKRTAPKERPVVLYD